MKVVYKYLCVHINKKTGGEFLKLHDYYEIN